MRGPHRGLNGARGNNTDNAIHSAGTIVSTDDVSWQSLDYPNKRKRSIVCNKYTYAILICLSILGLVAIITSVTVTQVQKNKRKASSPLSQSDDGSTTATSPKKDSTDESSPSDSVVPERPTTEDEPNAPTPAPMMAMMTAEPTFSLESSGIRPGLTANNIPYYACDPGADTPVEWTYRIVLLHGSGYSKDVWVEHGVMQRLCQNPSLGVAALDLPSSAGYGLLKQSLDGLYISTEGKHGKPAILVTPSASGWTMVDWIMHQDNTIAEMLTRRREDIESYVEIWIPVSTGSLDQATDEQIQSLAPMPVLAIHGNADEAGATLSGRLRRLLYARVVELEGDDEVYISSPNEFADAIISYLGV